MKKGKMSIGDIAKELNISITTVSFILNGKAEEKRISSELTKKVMKLVNDVGYVPNHLAKSLRTGKTNIIGLIVEDISNPFFANVARLIEESANRRSYKIFYCSSDNDTHKTKELIKVFKERHVDGYIITPVPGIQHEVESLISGGCSVVLFDRYFPDVDTNYVVVDNAGSTYNATNHFIEQGYKTIAFITLDSDQTQMQERLNGYKRAVKENHMKAYIKKIPYQEKSNNYIEQIQRYLDEQTAVDAVFFATNYLGISGLEAIRNLNRRIPSEIGVISFDDHDLFRLHSPSITAVAQPINEMSEQVMNILLDNIGDEQLASEKRKVILHARLIIRNSSLSLDKEVKKLQKISNSK